MKKVKKKAGGFQYSPAHVSQKRILGETKVYVMHNIPVFVASKFGITDHVKARRKDVSESTPGYVFYILPPALVPWGWNGEQLVHLLYCWANLRNFIPFWWGSGRSEWFLNINPIVGYGVWYLCEHFGAERLLLGRELLWWEWLFVFFSPLIWLDGWLWWIIFSAFKYVLAVAMVVTTIYLLKTMM